MPRHINDEGKEYIQVEHFSLRTAHRSAHAAAFDAGARVGDRYTIGQGWVRIPPSRDSSLEERVRSLEARVYDLESALRNASHSGGGPVRGTFYPSGDGR